MPEGKWKPWIEGLSATRQPDYRKDYRRAVDAEHDKRRLLNGLGNVERELGEKERAEDRDEQNEPRSDHREQDVE